MVGIPMVGDAANLSLAEKWILNNPIPLPCRPVQAKRNRRLMLELNQNQPDPLRLIRPTEMKTTWCLACRLSLLK
jgi:hypothetical protein